MPAKASPEALAALQAQLKKEVERRERVDPVKRFPWHDQQKWALKIDRFCRKDLRIMLVLGGNRGGKSHTGKGLYGNFMRRKSQLARKLTTTDRLTGKLRRKNKTDPVTVWIVPPTLEKARQDWINPSDGYSIKYWLGDLYVDFKLTPDLVYYSRPPGMSAEAAQEHKANKNYDVFDKTILKSHDQDILSFEASGVDLIIVDEEIQDEAKWNSMLMRIATTNGSIVMCYTPIHGLSWTYHRYFRPLAILQGAKKRGDRRWVRDEGDGPCVVIVQFGAADNPMARQYAREIENDPGMSEAEKNARLYGEYGFVEGSLIPALSGLDVISPDPDHEVYVVDHLPGERPPNRERVPGAIVQWLLVADPNKSFGAVLCAIDGAGNLFFVSEHLEEAWPDRMHAEAFQRIEKKYVKPGARMIRIADPGSAGAHAMVNLADLGVPFENVHKPGGSVSRSIKTLRGMAHVDPEHLHPITEKRGAPRLYFYRPGIISQWKDEQTGMSNIGCRLAEQISQARQTDNKSAPPDTPHKDNKNRLDLFDCARYAAEYAAGLPDLTDEHPAYSFRHPRNVVPDLGDSALKVDPLDREIPLPDYFS